MPCIIILLFFDIILAQNPLASFQQVATNIRCKNAYVVSNTGDNTTSGCAQLCLNQYPICQSFSIKYSGNNPCHTCDSTTDYTDGGITTIDNNGADYFIYIEPTPGVTSSPSVSPTPSPSNNPTNNPSISPSKNPTHLPSISPSSVPSKSPSLFPTYTPSVSPTKIPSVSPIPSKLPTNSPTLSPSSPTLSPTLKPTRSPLPEGVTSSPSVSPTRSPLPDGITYSPSISPTQLPTQCIFDADPKYFINGTIIRQSAILEAKPESSGTECLGSCECDNGGACLFERCHCLYPFFGASCQFIKWPNSFVIHEN